MGTRILNAAILAIIATTLIVAGMILTGGDGGPKLDWETEFLEAAKAGSVSKVVVGTGQTLKVQLVGDETMYSTKMPDGVEFGGVAIILGWTTESPVEVVGHELPTPLPTIVVEQPPLDEEGVGEGEETSDEAPEDEGAEPEATAPPAEEQ